MVHAYWNMQKNISDDCSYMLLDFAGSVEMKRWLQSRPGEVHMARLRVNYSA